MRGPLLFLVYYYVNGMVNAVPNHIIKLFANDTNLFVFGDNITDVERDASDSVRALVYI